MELKTFKALILATTIVPVVTLPNSVLAQVDQSRLLPNSIYSTVSRNQESRIVISVREFSQKDNLCESRFGYVVSDGDASSFATGGDWGGFDFPHAGRRRAENFSHSSQSIRTFSSRVSRSFQLPAGSANPDIVGCVDTQRNVVFIHIKPQQKLPTQLSPSVPVPPPQQSPPFTPVPPLDPAQIDLQTEILSPQRHQPMIK